MNILRPDSVTVRCLLAIIGLLMAVPLARAETGRFYLQWENVSAERPWLASVSVRIISGSGSLVAWPLGAVEEDYAHGMAVDLTGTGSVADPVNLQVILAGGYGFTVPWATLQEQPYVWVKDLGIYLSARGTWTQTADARAVAAAAIAQSLQEPFVSCSEHYFRWTGLTEHEPDDIHVPFWDFFAAKQKWPVTARAADHIARMPEVDVGYFIARVPDLKFHRMFLGWPEHNDQFTVHETGRIGVSSQSVGGHPEKFPDIPWHPRAGAYTLQFGVGISPTTRFREPGDDEVRQHLEDGHRLMVTSAWTDAGVRAEQTTFAVPLDERDEVRTGIEPLVAWSKLRITNLNPAGDDVYLGVRFTDQDYVTFMSASPLPGLSELTWRDGAFRIRDQLVAVTDPALIFEEVPVSAGKEFRARVPLAAGATGEYWVANLYRPVPAGQAAGLRRDGGPAARARMMAYWDRVAAKGASITVPEPWFNNLYRTFLPRVLNCAHLDPQGMAVLHTGPVIYPRMWHHITAAGVVDLSRRGHFDLAKRYLEPFFRWQDTPAPDSPAIADWTGFFGAPPEQCPKVWISFHGRILWAAARYYELSGDRAWLDEKLPALLRGMEWARRARAQTMKLAPDGTRPLDYGWLPPGRAGDGKESGTGMLNDSNTWLGLDSMTRVLGQIGHPRAAEWRRETADYHACLMDGERRSSAQRPLLRLNDDTWVPYLPAFLHTKGNETALKYVNLVDGGWAMGIFDSGVLPPGSPELHWLVSQFEDNFSPLNPALADEPFTRSGLDDHLARDRIESYLYAFYSQSVNTLARETLTTFEHRSWGQKRVFDLTPWAAGAWTTNFIDMLCRTTGRELSLLQAIPRRWLNDGEKIEVRNLQTEFGPVSFTIRSRLAAGTIEAEIRPPSRSPAAKLRLRLRAPDGRKIREVLVDGRPWTEFDPAGEWITLPSSAGTLQVAVRY